MKKATRSGRVRAGLLGTVCAVAGLTLSTPAHAAVTKPGVPSGVQVKVFGGPALLKSAPATGTPGAITPKAAPAAPAAPVCPKAAPDPACNMTYHSGSVLHTNNDHVVYWAPTGFTYAAAYKTTINQYLTDVAADSGRVSNPYAVNTQYSDTTNGNILNQQTFAGAIDDTNAYPASDAACKLAGSATVCLTTKQERDELAAFVKANHLPFGATELYFLVLPTNVQTCFDGEGDCGPYGPGTSGDEYCAYHEADGTSDGTLDWANMPNGADAGCNPVPHAPNNQAADTLIDSLSHEHNEAITDPDGGGWYDVNLSGENGDKCNDTFTAPVGQNATDSYDVLINHHGYEIQPEWSNAITGCTMTSGAVAPTAAFTTAPATPKIGDTVTLDASGSKSNDAGGYIDHYAWTYGDGASTPSKPTPTTTHVYANAGTFTATLTITDDAGLTATVSHSVVVAKRATKLTVDGPTSVSNGTAATLKGTLTDDKGAAVAGRTVSFQLGAGASAQTCSGTTNATGHASCTIASVNQPAASTSAAITDAFAGDGNYLPSSGSGSAGLRFYTGRGYALSAGLLGLPPLVFSDTGAISTSVASNTSQSLVSVSLLGVNSSVLSSNVTTGGGTSTSTASSAGAGVGLLGLPVIAVGAVKATSTTTCAAATGSVTIASLSVGGVALNVGNPAPNTTLNLGLLKIVLNEQIPVPGASQGLTVNAVHITSPGLLDLVESSAESDIHNC